MVKCLEMPQTKNADTENDLWGTQGLCEHVLPTDRLAWLALSIELNKDHSYNVTEEEGKVVKRKK